MKPIDLLVQELPKRGGWPGDDAPGFYSFLENNNITFEFDFGCAYFFKNQHGDTVNRAQYEAALAASQKVEWGGVGMPPIGQRVIFFLNPCFDYDKEIVPPEGTEMEVVAHKKTSDGNEVAVCYWDKNGGGMAVCLVPDSLMPGKSEADKKRDEAIKKIVSAICGEIPDTGMATAAKYAVRTYDAIAAGKIPGVRIE